MYKRALEIFHEWTQTESLRRHGYAVEAAMREYARQWDEDEELWATTGLLHDMDYERHPSTDDHPFVGVAHLRERGFPEEMLQAILGHADYSGVARETRLARTLYAVDELAGLVTAAALVRPTRIEGMSVKSVKKKLKDKAFAAAVSRDDIRQGAADLGVELDAHIATVIAGLERDKERLGLAAP